MKITVVGSGYVGMSISMLFKRADYDVTILDIDEARVNKINSGVSPIEDKEITQLLNAGKIPYATLNTYEAFKDSEIIFIATPTDYNEETGYFDTDSIVSVLSKIQHYSRDFKTNPIIVIKSTIPIGFTKNMRFKFPGLNILFSPEFLREGSALKDNIEPSRIIIGDTGPAGQKVGKHLALCADNKPEVIFMESGEAESVKLFANCYLAMRVAFFNELDSFAYTSGMDTKSIINGVCSDPRIGYHYNNPSFGFGGYCFPKDTKQLAANFDEINLKGKLINAVVESNYDRKLIIARDVKDLFDGVSIKGKRIGIYRLAMKSGSDNFRASAIQDIILRLKQYGFDVVIYEPIATGDSVLDCPLIKFEELWECDLVLANRVDSKLSLDNFIALPDAIFTRDVFHDN